MSLKVQKINSDSTLPVRGSALAAGYDLFSCEGYVILPGHRACVATGIKIQLPEKVYGRIAPRSGLTVKNGIQVGAGVIDRDYTGEIKVVLFNQDKHNAFIIKPGYRIAQLILERCECPPIEEVNDVESTQRGEGGFGSTGGYT
jgi:dUTP pyrophosphatase